MSKDNQVSFIDWHDHFGRIFFKAWKRVGLPDPAGHITRYIAQREHQQLPGDWIKTNHKISPGIHGTRLYSVYGFGNIVGNVFSDLFGLSPEQKEKASDWCGRFNLGISLFDFITDEQEGATELIKLPVFQKFSKSDTAERTVLTPAQELLVKLTADVLEEFIQTGFSLEDLQPLFDAQLYLSQKKIHMSVDLLKIQKALFIKSAEPFSLMAAFVARHGGLKDQERMKRNRSLGQVLGKLYWMVDDARDIWTDLNEGNWNLFLAEVARLDPALFQEENQVYNQKEITDILQLVAYPEALTHAVLEELTGALDSLHTTQKTKDKTMGLIAASLQEWLG
ncbi:hypothetical protein SAMN06265375_101301 [Muriicola jejuensis]|uniref:Class 1 isoprenoid biosynthesis enzyme n=1 Tax=Muriicola jejuensis TaxID=504488 RepID=A0A6P0UA36_9FLAO|nr:hypothetical protein [Muriicola jejuensis]NER10161.1 hypothetical protein [Muriicola jejuensis]SMP02612.1 hypothetical protein SAMN06265375_101301 [Muriicola jejuensis]